MKIIVCIKQVPDTNEVKLDQKTGTLIREGVPSIINPDDKAGLEAALQLKDKYGAEVTVLSMGPMQAEVAIREALAMGADQGILVSDRKFGGADTWATSKTLASAISKLSYDLIITGRQAIDGDTAQVGPQIAEHLNIPHISYAEEIGVDSKDVMVKRQYEDHFHMLKVKMPCLITALSELGEPRYMTPGNIFAAWREKEITVWGREDLNVEDDNIGLKGSPTRVKRSFTKAVKGSGVKVELDPQESAGWIIEQLKAKHIL